MSARDKEKIKELQTTIKTLKKKLYEKGGIDCDDCRWSIGGSPINERCSICKFFNKWEPETEEEINEFLRETGHDPDAIARDICTFVTKLIQKTH